MEQSLIHPVLIDHQVAHAWRFTYAVIGDSPAAECPWKWSFGFSPVAVANSAVAGATYVASPSDRAGARSSAEIYADLGGLDGLINYEARLDEVE